MTTTPVPAWLDWKGGTSKVHVHTFTLRKTSDAFRGSLAWKISGPQQGDKLVKGIHSEYALADQQTQDLLAQPRKFKSYWVFIAQLGETVQTYRLETPQNVGCKFVKGKAFSKHIQQVSM